MSKIILKQRGKDDDKNRRRPRRGQRARKVLTSITIDEISAVDVPAQEGAQATIIKRKSAEAIQQALQENLQKRVTLTSAVDGHTHLVGIEDFNRGISGGMTSFTEDHDHPFVINADGTITIGEAMGHTHTVEETVEEIINKTASTGGTETVEEDPMTDKTSDDQAEMTKRLNDLETQLKKANALAALSDVEKTFKEGLSDEAAEEFLNKSAEDRKADMEAAAEDDPVVYKAENGDVFRKSDDPRMVKMARDYDTSQKQLIQERAMSKAAALRKRAEDEFKTLPGEIDTKVAVLKAIGGIECEKTRKAAESMLKAHAGKMSPMFKSQGTSTSSGEDISDKDSANEELTQKAHAMAKAKDMNFYDAYDVVVSDPENADLLAATR